MLVRILVARVQKTSNRILALSSKTASLGSFAFTVSKLGTMYNFG